MEIRPYSRYLETEILPLYRAVGWSNYYMYPEMLRGAYENSLCILGAYEGSRLVGIIRAVGTGIPSCSFRIFLCILNTSAGVSVPH